MIVKDETFFGRIDVGPHVEAVFFFGTEWLPRHGT